ncbi:MAG: hypothetical protein ABSF22_17855 [Bryobacteraceae bacterium]
MRKAFQVLFVAMIALAANSSSARTIPSNPDPADQTPAVVLASYIRQ